MGMAVWGFLASSPLVAMESKPTKPKKQVAAPASVPETPNAKNPPESSACAGRDQFLKSALKSPEIQESSKHKHGFPLLSKNLILGGKPEGKFPLMS